MRCHYLLLMLSCGWGNVQAEDITVVGNLLHMPSALQFQSQGSELLPDDAPTLAAVRDFLEQKSYITTLRIEGHVAGQDKNANQVLSEARAVSVARALIALGVDCRRLLAVGFGGSKPVMSNATAEGRAANNRIEFAVAALRNRAIGGMPLDGGGKIAGESCGAGQ